MSNAVNRFLGGSPFNVLIKLIVVSIFVGFIMKFFGWYPLDLLYAVQDFLIDLWHKGFAALGQFGDYLMLGGAVVVPVFILLRLLSYKRS